MRESESPMFAGSPVRTGGMLLVALLLAVSVAGCAPPPPPTVSRPQPGITRMADGSVVVVGRLAFTEGYATPRTWMVMKPGPNPDMVVNPRPLVHITNAGRFGLGGKGPHEGTDVRVTGTLTGAAQPEIYGLGLTATSITELPDL